MTVHARPIPAALKVLAALLFAGLFFFGLQAPAAHAVGPLDITVHVATKSGAPLSGMSVYAYPIQNHAVVGDGFVADYIGPGEFKFQDSTTSESFLSSGTYAIYFDAPASATTAFDQFWGGTTFVEEAHYWQYADGRDLHITLATNSVFTGKVTGTSSKALSGVAVYPWRWDGNDFYRLDPARVTTSSTGVYTMRDLEPGTYKIEFAPANTTGYLSKFSGPLTVGLGATVTSNAALSVGASLSGTVQLYDTLGGPTPVKVQSNGVTARAYPLVGGNIDTSVSYASKPTSTTGKWTISGLPTGAYKVKVYDTLDPDNPAYVDKWLQDSEHVAGATTYNVVAGHSYTQSGTTRMDFYQDTPDTSLVLNVKNHTGTAAAPDDTSVYIVSTSGEDFSAYFLLSGGTTYFAFLPVGDYDVYVDSPDAADGPSVASQSIASGTPNTWDITLPSPSSFTYATPASIAESATAVGTTYTVNRGATSFSDSKVQYSYIWLRNDAPIFGSQSSTSSTYTSRGVDADHKISVIVRADSFGYDSVFSTVVAANPVTTGPAPVNTDPPLIVGPPLPVAGSVLTADVGTWNATGLSFAYQWLSDGNPIAGATSRAYTVLPTDAGHQIAFTLTASRVGYVNGVAGSDNLATIGHIAAPKLTKNPVYSAKVVGANLHLTTTNGTWSPVPTSYSYAWLADDVIVGTTASFDCALVDCPATAAIGLQIVAHRTGYVDSTRTYLVRKGSLVPPIDGSGSVYDNTPSFRQLHDGDPAWVTHVLHVQDPTYTYPLDDGGTITRAYQWQRKTGSTWASIKGATKSTYTPTTADAGHPLQVRITTASTRYASVVALYAAGTGTLLPDLAAVTEPQIYGSGDVGIVKSVYLPTFPVSSVTFAYQWYTCNNGGGADCTDQTSANPNWKAISGATKSTFLPSAALDNTGLLVQVKATKANYATYLKRSPGMQLGVSDNVGYIQGSTATITGTVASAALVGRSITGKPGVTDRTAGVTHVYEWQVCDGQYGACTTAPGAPTGLTVTPDDSWRTAYADSWLRFVDHISVNGAPRVDGFSPTYPIGLGTNTPIVAPKVALSAGTYTASSTWNDSTVSYEWLDNGSSESNVATYTPASTTTPITVEVTVTRPGYNDVHLEVVARKGTLPAQDLAITGARYGDTLTAPDTFVPVIGGQTVKYQWYSGSTAISGKTAATFVPSTAYIGKALKVKITLGSPRYNTKTYYSTPVVLGSHLAATGTPVIVSSLPNQSPGSKLTVDRSSFPAGMTYTYSWQRSTNGGASWSAASTASSFTVSASDVTKMIRVVVVAKRTGWASSAGIASAPVTVGYAPALALTTPFVLNGTGKVDGVLSAATTWNTTGYALSYSWTRNGITIPGAVGSSITPTASWIGDEVQAHVTATKAGYAPVTVHSNEVLVSKAAAPTSAAPTISFSGNTMTSTPGVWNVAGLTLKFAWYDEVNDPGHTTSLSATASYTTYVSGTYTVVITAIRAGYADGTITKSITVDVP